MFYGIVFLLIIYFFTLKIVFACAFHIKNENTGFFISHLTMTTCCSQKLCFRDNFSQKKL